MSVIDFLFGKPLPSHEESTQRVGPLTGIPMLGLDALGSAAYGPEAALTLLIPLGVLSVVYIVPISAVIIGLLFIVYISYQQTITAYPNGCPLAASGRPTCQPADAAQWPGSDRHRADAWRCPGG